MREILYLICRIEIPLKTILQKNLPYKYFIKIYPNALQAAALRALADFIFAFRFHFSSHNHFPYRQTPH